MKWLCLLLVGLSGCPGPGDDQVDTPPAGGTALHLQWTARPSTIPGPIDDSGDVTIEKVRLDIANLRFVGDAGSTSTPPFELRWDSGKTPSNIEIANTAEGLYSRLAFDIRGTSNEDAGIEISGTAKIRGTDERFQIEKLGRASVELNELEISLQAGHSVLQEVRVDLKHALDSVDFEELPVEGGVRKLTRGESQANDFLNALRESFMALPPQTQ